MRRHIRVMVATLLILSGVLVFLPCGEVSAGGMVTNPGFEVGEDEAPWQWSPSGNAVRIDTGPIYAGGWAALVTGEGDMLTQWIDNIIPVVTYEAWGWIYVSGNVTGEIMLDFWAGKEGTQLAPTTILRTDDTKGYYVQKSSTMYAPQGTTHLRIRLRGTNWAEGGTVRFDEIGFYAIRMLCFVATAAYGTETAEQLGILRDFRDQVLLHSVLGSRFVAAYYRVSPPVADFIAQNDFLRAVVRETLINPVVTLLQWSQSLWRGQPDTT